MVKELIINSTPSGVNIALLQDKQLVELNKEQINNNYAVGDIYMGRIKKIMPGLNAAFVNVGYEKDAFLHYLDLGPQFSSLQKFTKLVRGKKFNGSKLEIRCCRGAASSRKPPRHFRSLPRHAPSLLASPLSPIWRERLP